MSDGDEMYPDQCFMHGRTKEQAHHDTLQPAGSAFYLSFCDPALPKETQFLGACFVDAVSLPDAVTAAWTLGINPGGEIAATVIGPERAKEIPLKWLHRLLSRDELDAFDAEMLA